MMMMLQCKRCDKAARALEMSWVGTTLNRDTKKRGYK